MMALVDVANEQQLGWIGIATASVSKNQTDIIIEHNFRQSTICLSIFHGLRELEPFLSFGQTR